MGDTSRISFIDASRLMIEGAVQAGAQVFVGYPITPANLLYAYSSRRFPIVLPAPDEITTLQWMSGFSAIGKIPVTATSYPGLALMTESIGMAFMMELPMVIVLVQRLGPSTGTATCGAQGDISMINGINSGGYPIPTLCPASFADCFTLSAAAVKLAVKLRSPVFVLTSKEMVMTLKSFDLSGIEPVAPVDHQWYSDTKEYIPYGAGENGIPAFLPAGSGIHQVRLTASTHDSTAALQHSSKDALANTERLRFKMERNLPDYSYFDYTREDSDTLVFSYGISAAASREAVANLRRRGKSVSLMTGKTLFPVLPEYLKAAACHSRVVVVEENQSGQYREILFGINGRTGVSGVNAIGRLITPSEIEAEVEK
jgi:2-oxoglutarate ferredoxin oxidoreductase subunit alpha